MAATQGVKCLNTSFGTRRFVFKTFSQRVNEIEIDVFRCLEPVKAEPSDGSSFFRDCLLEWRELNTAEDFISFYDEFMPIVQTLPQILLHKENIFSGLLFRVNMKAKLSLEPILRLIAALSRDILEDFLPFMSRLVNSLHELFKNGGERDSDVLEQVFTSWSYVLLHLQKYLVKDIVNILRITADLRYYPNTYIQEFMAEAVSFLLRNAPKNQVSEGVRRVILEATEDYSESRRTGASALLWHVMRGTTSKLHSKAEQVLRLLMDGSLLIIDDAVVDLVNGTLERLFEALEPKELTLACNCLLEEIRLSDDNEHLDYLIRLLSVLIYAVRLKKGTHIFDYLPILELVKLLVKKYVTVSGDLCSDLINKLLELMLSLLEVQSIVNELSPESQIVLEWGAVFQSGNPRLLSFIREILTKNSSVLNSFKTQIISALDDLIKTSSDEVLYLLMTFFERGVNSDSLNALSSSPENKFNNIRDFFEERLRYWSTMILSFSSEESKSQLSGLKTTDLSALWGILKSYPYFFRSNEKILAIKSFMESIIHLLSVDADETAGISRTVWQNIGAASLLSYQKLFSNCLSGHEDICKILQIGWINKSSSQLLFAVAEYLNSQFRLMKEKDEFREVSIGHAASAVKFLGENLSHSDKLLRISSLRILSHFARSYDHPLNDDPPPNKKLKIESSESTVSKSPSENVISLLLSIEETSLAVSTSRMITVIISKIQMNIAAGKIEDDYLPLLMNGLIGIFHNRFGYLWEPIMECISVLISKSKHLAWSPFVECLEKVQSQFLLVGEVDLTGVDCLKPDGLMNCFNISLATHTDSTPLGTILSLLIRTLQKVPDVAEARSRQIVPLFLKFLNLEFDDISSEATISPESFMGKGRKPILKEWLNLFRLMHNSRSLYHNQTLKSVLINRLLDDTDPDTQMKVLDCVLNWKDDYLLPYGQHLKNLVNSKTLREELTTWSLAKESHQIEETHRDSLIPITIRILAPKVRKLKTLASRKHASVNHRRAILCFLTQLEVNELPLFFSLLLNPLFFSGQLFDQFLSLPLGFLRSEFLSTVIAQLSSKKKFSFLRVVEDVLRCFDESHIKPFLDLLLAVVIKILEWCTISISASRGSESLDLIDDSASGQKRKRTKEEKDNKRLSTEAKDLRTLCLKIFCSTLNKYGNHNISSEIWDIFFSSAKPLIDNFIQDISGSENPGSLLLCFVAMSKNPCCVSLLDEFLPKIFSVLTLKTASESVISSVFRFIENLLVLDGELDHEDGPVKRILAPHLKDLFAGLCQFFQRRKMSQRKVASWPAREEIRIFRLLGRYVTEKSIAREFVDIVLPFFMKKGLTPDECMEGLHVIQGILPMIDSDTSKKILNVISIVLSSAGPEIRLLICNILHGLSTVDHSLTFLAKLLHDFNAISSTELDEIDYDTRIGAYEAVTVELFSSLDYDRASIILSQCFNDIASDLILRQAASRALISFIDFSASYLNLDGAVSDEKEADNADGYIWSRKQIQKIILKFFLQKISETMNGEISSKKFLSTELDMSIHKEWIILLREMVWKLPGVPALLSLRPLCSEDPEVDFFHNIFHLQTYRRAKALQCFRNAVSVENLSEEMMEKLFIPLFLTMMFEIKGGKGEHLKNAFIDSLASISSKMQWKPYNSFLMNILSFIYKTHSKSDKQKILIRLLISILDNFHFCNGDVRNEKDSDLIHRSLQNKILPQIQKFLDSDSERINVQMSLAALKVLKLLPEEILESQLQSIIRRTCNFLKNRLESIRDEARSALSACLNVLGIGYLSFIVKVLQSTLKRGYEMRVLGYTVNFILSKLSIESSVGAFDSCMEDILFIAENDILGSVSEEEAAKIASRMKESRKKKSFETIKLVSQNITFKTHALKLLSPIKKHLQNHLTMKTKSKIEMMLSCIASGIEANPSVDEKELLIFIYGLLDDSDKDDNRLQNSHLISLFALGLLHTRLKNMKLNKKNEELLSMLDPFIKLLASFLSSKYEDILSSAFKCLIPLSRLPLPSLEFHADKIKILLLDITQRSSNVSSQLTQSSLKLLTALLQTTTVSLSNDQLHLLVQFPIFIDIQSKPSHLALSLLKAIVSRKLVVPEIYDLVVKISELMVTSQEDAVRKKCSHILLQFLIDYRISSKRLQQHLDFLLANLSYEHSSGREAVLEMLHAVVVKLPPAVVESQAQSWFLHLVVALANDTDKNVQTMISAVIKLLLDRISQKTLHPILEYSLSWYKGEKPHLWSAAAQVLGLVADILKKGFMKHSDIILPVAKFIMNSAIDEVTKKTGSGSSDLVPLWKEAYHTLLMLEKMLSQCPELYVDQSFEEIWEAICKLLLHPHAWVRNTSNRLLALYFSEAASTKRSIHQENIFFNSGRLFLLAVSFCIQLKSKSLDSDNSATNLIIQNLLFTLSGIHSCAKVVGPIPVHDFWGSLSPQEQRFYFDGFDLLGSRKGRNLFIFYASKDGAREGKNPNLQSLLVFPLLGKMGKIALSGDDNQAKIVFDCFRRISLQFGREDCAEYAIQLLSPLYRICEGFSGREISDEVKDLANDVLGKMRGVLGAESFLKAYNEIRKSMKEKRDKRRQTEKLLAVINPMRHAQRKLRIAAKHKAHKKKKVAAMKMKKWKR